MATSAPIRILTVDDHPLLLEGLAVVIRSQPDMVLVGQASNCREALQQFQKVQPDVTLMDLRLPDMSGTDAMIAIQTEFPAARVIMMTTFESDGPVQRALEAGARSYILKNMPPREIVEIIRQVHAGKKRVAPGIAGRMTKHPGDETLTDRDVDVLRLAPGGIRNRDISDKLFFPKETVKAHLKHIMEKLGVSGRTQAVPIAARGIFQL